MKTMTREEAIAALRSALLELSGDEHSICSVASKLKVFCGGFSQWKTHELRERYGWMTRRNPHIGRPQLEDLADRWQLARQFVRDVPLACDVQSTERQTCLGWDEFDDAELAEDLLRLTGERVSVVRCPASDVRAS